MICGLTGARIAGVASTNPAAKSPKLGRDPRFGRPVPGLAGLDPGSSGGADDVEPLLELLCPEMIFKGLARYPVVSVACLVLDWRVASAV